MLIAQYKGYSLQSRAIRFLTRSVYSHSAFVIDESAQAAAHRLYHRGVKLNLGFTHDGAVIEAWNPVVRCAPDLSSQHSPNTWVDVFALKKPLTNDQEEALLIALSGDIGDPYDWKNVFRFVTRKPGNLDESWFCSELVYQRLNDVGVSLFEHTQAWEVPPGWIPRSTLLRDSYSVLTTARPLFDPTLAAHRLAFV